jgi:hypothetical protein
MNFLKTVFAYVKAHWVTVLALGTAVWNYVSPTVTSFVTSHPKYAVWVGLAGVIISFYLKYTPPITKV